MKPYLVIPKSDTFTSLFFETRQFLAAWRTNEGWEFRQQRRKKMKKHLTLLDKLLRDSLVSLCFFPSEVSGANQWPPPNLTTRPTGFISSFTKSMNLLYGLLALLTRHHSTDIFTVHSVFISKNIYHVLSLKYSFLIPIPLTPMKCAMIFPSIKKINV